MKLLRDCHGTGISGDKQLAVEVKWLAGRHLPDSFLKRLPESSPVEQEINARVRETLGDPRLVPFLNILNQHNGRPRCEPGRRTPSKTPFLLGPHLFGILDSVRARKEIREKIPVLDQPAAEVRAHLKEVSAKCRALAKLIMRGPQPRVALAGETNTNAVLGVFASLIELFEASDGSERQVVPFTDLMKRAAAWFEARADDTQRAKQNRHTGAGALRIRTAEFLPGVFRKRLGHPYHAHVAIIATIVSGIDTNADFVKKVESQQTGIEPRRAGERLSRKRAETLT
jgi:hypothetical protein